MSAATLGARIKSARETAGLTQRQLGVDSGLLSRLENGKVADPAISTLEAIAKALGVSVEELTTGKASAVRMVPLCDIEADPENPRTVDVATTVDAAFVDSIREHGLLQAVTVRRMPADHDGRPWRIAFGGRRYASLVLIHGPKAKLPVPVLVAKAEGADLLLKQLVENIARADMNAADMAQAVTKLVDAKMDTASLAAVLKKGRRWVQEQASVGHYLTADSMEALRKGAINISQAVAIAAERDEERQNNLMARAGMQDLSEDEIRAIIADRRAQESAAKEAERAKAEPALIEDTDAAPDKEKQPAPKPVGGWKTWRSDHGYFKWQLFKVPAIESYVVETKAQWRRDGSIHICWSALGRRFMASPSQALAFAVLEAWSEFDTFVNASDKPALLTSLLPWINKGMRNLGADSDEGWRLSSKIEERVQAKFAPVDNLMRKPAPAPTPSSNNRKVKMTVPAPPIDTSVPPEWARPMINDHFMLHCGATAWLCRGWGQLVKTYVDEGAPEEDLRALYDRKNWENNGANEPFDFGGMIVRLTDAPI